MYTASVLLVYIVWEHAQGKVGCSLIFKPQMPLGHTFPLVCPWGFPGLLDSCQTQDVCLALGHDTWVCSLVFALLVGWLLILRLHCLKDT